MWSFNRILNVTRFDRNFVLTLFDIISLYPNREVSDGIIDFVVRHYMCYVSWSTKLKIFFETTAITFIRSICNGVSFVRINRRAVNHSETEKNRGSSTVPENCHRREKFDIKKNNFASM